jgi:undecaprenyl-diphosphatase
VATALILLATERLARRAHRRRLDGRVAATVGLAQAVSISPGISRSGATIGAGLWLGLSREEATRFSFLLSIPAIAGAGLVSMGDLAGGEFELTAGVVAGVIASGISGYLSIGGLLRYIRTRSLIPFAIYLLVVAPMAAIVITWRG